jgi:hypothetical protein
MDGYLHGRVIKIEDEIENLNNEIKRIACYYMLASGTLTLLSINVICFTILSNVSRFFTGNAWGVSIGFCVILCFFGRSFQLVLRKKKSLVNRIELLTKIKERENVNEN